MKKGAGDRDLTAGIYIRLSKEDRNKTNKEDDSESIANQRRMLLDYCAENGLNVYDIYNDEDFSGSDRDRPEFNRMISDAKNGRFSIIVCKTQSRFARDMEVVERYINGLFPLWGIRFIGVVDNTDSTNTRTLKQRQINSLVDEWYISDLSANVRATLSSKRREGLWVGAFAPFGYVKDPDNKNKLVIDEEAAEIVRYVFSLYIGGMGIAAITRRLNEEGVPNPATYKQRHGQPFQNSHGVCSDIWHTYSIGRMLSNEVYIGNVVQGMSENVSYKSTKKRQKHREDWDVVEGVHEPIIDRDIWDKAQSLRAGKPKPIVKCAVPNVFANKLRCAECGGGMRIFYSRHRRYYRCSTKFVAKGRCGGKYISEKVLNRIVLDEIRKLYDAYVNDEDTAKQLEDVFGIETKTDILKESIEKARREEEVIDKRLEALYIDKLDGVITNDEFRTLKNRFGEEKTKVQQRLSRLQTELAKAQEQRKNARNCLETVRRFKDVKDLDFDTVQTLIDHIEIDGSKNDRIVNIYWNV